MDISKQIALRPRAILAVIASLASAAVFADMPATAFKALDNFEEAAPSIAWTRGSGAAAISLSDEDAQEGKSCLKAVSGADRKKWFFLQFQATGAGFNDVEKISFWHKGDGSGQSLNIFIVQKSGEEYCADKAIDMSETEWRKMELTADNFSLCPWSKGPERPARLDLLQFRSRGPMPAPLTLLVDALGYSVRIKTAEIDVGPMPRSLVNRRMLGQNILAYQKNKPYSMQGGGVWNPEKGEPVPEMMAFLKETGARTLRWPGGCETHEYNWKLTVGPLAERPEQAFGLPEFLKCCEELQAEPVITLADYWGAPEDFADIVEYLNSPVGQNPNGGKDWAAVRASDGHSEPYNVVWFEYGNESDHGPHRRVGNRPAWQPYTPAEYAGLYKKVRQAMKAVDSKVKLGAVLVNETHPLAWSQWTLDVIKLAGSDADFFITHPYLPKGFYNWTQDSNKIFQVVFGSYRQFHCLFKNLQAHIQKTTGRRIPIAATEYNGLFCQEKPVPYRLCLGTAVEVADLALTLMDPELNVDNAQYWQFSNEYWGMIAGYKAPYKRRPAFYAFNLCDKYLGETFLEAKVRGDSYAMSGGCNILAAGAAPPPLDSLDTAERKLTPKWRVIPADAHKTKIESDGTLSIKIADKPFDYWHAMFNMPAKPLVRYLVTAEIQTDGISDAHMGVGIQVGDGRGWDVTRSCSTSNVCRGTGWQKVSCSYYSLADTQSLVVMARRLGVSMKEGQPCEFRVRNLAVKECGVMEDLGRVPSIGAYASAGKDGAGYLILTNHETVSPTLARISGLKGSQASAETLSGPSVSATNESSETCKITILSVAQKDGAIEVLLPPHSISGIKAW